MNDVFVERKALIDLLPEFMKQFKEFKEMMKAEDEMLSVIDEQMQMVLDNAFISECNETGLKKYEDILHITPDAEDTIEERRTRVLLHWNDSLPYTIKVLIAKLNNFCGEENYKIEYLPVIYKLTVILNIVGLNMAEDVQELLEKIIPLNMEISTVCDAVREIKAEQYLYGNVTVTKHYNIS